MSDEVLVRVDGVGKKFCRSLKKSLWYGVCDIASELNPFGRAERMPGAGLSTAAASALDSTCSASALDARPSTLDSRLSTLDSSSGLRAGEFFAVKDVSFELRRGECLGLIGHNGANQHHAVEDAEWAHQAGSGDDYDAGEGGGADCAGGWVQSHFDWA